MIDYYTNPDWIVSKLRVEGVKQYTNVMLNAVCKFTKDGILRHGRGPWWVCTHGFAICEDDMPQHIQIVAINHSDYLGRKDVKRN